MFGFFLQMASGALAPLVDQVADRSARLFRKLALFIVAALCLVVVIAALTLAFGLWIASLAGAIAGVLSVAGVYLLAAIAAVALAMRSPRKDESATERQGDAKQGRARAARDHDLESQIDTFTAPLMGILQSLGLRREQLAVFAGASIAKRLGPVPLVGLAIVAGFLIGRTHKNWRGLVSLDAMIALLASAGLFGLGSKDGDSEDEPSGKADTKKAA